MRRIPRLWRPRSLGLVLLVLALAGFSGVLSAYHCCGVGEYCPDPGDPPPPINWVPPPPPTAVPTATSTPAPDWSWVENLPNPGTVATQPHTAHLESCTDVEIFGYCIPNEWTYYDSPIVQTQTYAPCCMGAAITTEGWFVYISDGIGDSPPNLYANSRIYSYNGTTKANSEITGIAFGDSNNSASNCPGHGVVEPGAVESITGCTTFSPTIVIYGANAVDDFGLDLVPDEDIPIDHYAQSTWHKFY